MDDKQKRNILVEILFQYIKFKEILPKIREEIMCQDLIFNKNKDVVLLLRMLEGKNDINDLLPPRHMYYRPIPKDYISTIGDSEKIKVDTKKNNEDYFKKLRNDEKKNLVSQLDKQDELESIWGEFEASYKGEKLIVKDGLMINPVENKWRDIRVSDYIQRNYGEYSLKQMKSFEGKETILKEIIEIIDTAMLDLDSREYKIIQECFISLKRKDIVKIAGELGIKSRTTIYKIQDVAFEKLISSIDFERVLKLNKLLGKKLVNFKGYDEYFDNGSVDESEMDGYTSVESINKL